MTKKEKCGFCGKSYVPDEGEEGLNECQECLARREEDKEGYELFMGSD